MNEDNSIIQYAAIGDLFSRGDTRSSALEVIEQIHFKGEYITVPELRSIYDVLIAEKSNDYAILYDAARKVASSETLQKAIGASACECDKTATHIAVQRHFTKLMDDGIKAALRAIAPQVIHELGDNASSENLVFEVMTRAKDFCSSILEQAKQGGYSLDEIGNPIPEDEDPNCLFRGRFLEKGAGLVLASVSGSGKSVISLQLAFAWAIGKPIFGIEPIRPLKIGIFQSEDSEQNMAQFAHDIQQGYRQAGWTEEDLTQAKNNIRIFPTCGKMDKDFLTYLGKEQMKAKFDLIFINPLTGVTSINISDNTLMNDFLCKKIDPLISYNEDTKCGLIIVHHTNKPPAQNQRSNVATDQYSQYIAAGASKLTNWMRSMLAIMPTGKQEQYYLIAAKHGEVLHWPALPGKNIAKPTRIIRHATPEEGIVFWYEVNDANGAPTATAAKKPSVTEDANSLAKQLQQNARPLTGARKLAHEMFKRRRGDNAYDEVVKNPDAYNLVIKSTGKSNMSVVGSDESVKTYFSELKEKKSE